MEKTRVNEGEMYWYVVNVCDGVKAIQMCDNRLHTDAALFKLGNYFHTKEEAEAMAEKIRAVLKGADVIEMPSEEKADAKKKELYPKEYNVYTGYYETPEQIEGFGDCYEWLKSKIVK